MEDEIHQPSISHYGYPDGATEGLLAVNEITLGSYLVVYEKNSKYIFC